MTIQNKINYSNPVAQNLYLLTLNDNFQKTLERIKSKHKEELSDIERLRKSHALATHSFGSNALKEDVENLIRKSPLYKRPEVHILRAMVVFLLTNVNISPLLREVNKNIQIKSLIPPPRVDIGVGENGSAIAISISTYHSEGDVMEAVHKIWPQLEKERQKYKSKTIPMSKFQPFTDFERDISVLSDKDHLSYIKISEKYSLEYETSKEIVRKIRKRIRVLYSS